MKKHIFAFICIFMLLLNTFVYIPIYAMDVAINYDSFFFDPHIFYSLNNGIEYDLSQYSNKEDFYKDIFVALTGQEYDPEDTDYYLNNSFYTYDFGYSNSQFNRINNAYSENVYNPQVSVLLPWLSSDIANWNKYQDLYVKKYLDAFNKNIEDHPENPDPFYQSFLDNINGHNVGQFFWYNISGQLGENYPTVGFFGDMPNQYTWCWINGGSNNIVVNNGYSTGYYVYPLTLSAINITNSSGTYSFDFSANIIPDLFGSASAGDTGVRRNGGQFEYSGWLGGFSDANASSFSLSYSGSLGECLYVIQTYMRNVSIYVDNELWDYVGTVQNPIVSAPDVIRNDDDEIVGNDIPVPAYDDLYIDIVKLDDFIEDAISNGDVINFDDVIDAGIIVDTNGDTITDQDVINKSISTIIDQEYDVANEDIIPPFTMPIKFFDFNDPNFGEDPRPRALSVLARIINVTQNGLPKPLIAMFWGICITLLILGIIKILHK